MGGIRKMAEKLQVYSIARSRPNRPIQQEYSSTDIGALALAHSSGELRQSCSEKLRSSDE